MAPIRSGRDGRQRPVRGRIGDARHRATSCGGKFDPRPFRFLRMNRPSQPVSVRKCWVAAGHTPPGAVSPGPRAGATRATPGQYAFRGRSCRVLRQARILTIRSGSQRARGAQSLLALVESPPYQFHGQCSLTCFGVWSFSGSEPVCLLSTPPGMCRYGILLRHRASVGSRWAADQCAEEDTSGGFTDGGWLIPYADEEMGTTVASWFAPRRGDPVGRTRSCLRAWRAPISSLPLRAGQPLGPEHGRLGHEVVGSSRPSSTVTALLLNGAGASAV